MSKDNNGELEFKFSTCERCGGDWLLERSLYLEPFQWLCFECATDEHLIQPTTQYYRRAAKAEVKYGCTEYHMISSLYISRLRACLKLYQDGDQESAVRAIQEWGIEV